MPPTDPPGGAPGTGFVGLARPATGRLHLHHIRLAPGYADFTPGDGPRRGWPKPVKWVETIDGQTVVWCGERRGVADLPANLAALTVAARLGCADLADRIGLRGDLLLAGIDASGGPADVPETVLQAAIGSGLLRATDRGQLRDPHSAAVVAEGEAAADAGSGKAHAPVGWVVAGERRPCSASTRAPGPAGGRVAGAGGGPGQGCADRGGPGAGELAVAGQVDRLRVRPTGRVAMPRSSGPGRQVKFRDRRACRGSLVGLDRPGVDVAPRTSAS